MINLLPPEEKDILQKEGKYRLAFILGVFVLFFLVALSLILFSIKIYLSGKAEGYSILVNFEQQKSNTLETQNIEKEINLTNQNLSELTTFYKQQPRLTELLKEISNLIPEGTYLTSLSLDPNQGEQGRFQVSLTGHSDDRDLLLGFKKSLESEPGFQGVYFPPSNWVKPEDINWSCSFEIVI